MKTLWWKFLRWKNDGIPCRQEAEHALITHKNSAGIQAALFLYTNGLNLEEIAAHENLTRERIRQYLMVGCARARNRKTSDWDEFYE